MKVTRTFLSALCVAAALCSFGTSPASPRAEQNASKKPTEKPPEKNQDKSAEKSAPKIPAEIELLETRVRFEANGDSRKEVHAHVKINDELGARQFARLNFNFNRAFEQIEIPLARITHPSGGVVDILPGAITDTPNSAVVNAPAYQDVRVKSVRILGLEPGDSLEYRVITTVSHHPLAPDFWLDHTFDRTGVVTHEIFELDLPTARVIQLHVESGFPYKIHKSEPRTDDRVVYLWELTSKNRTNTAEGSSDPGEPDVVLSTFQDWDSVVSKIAPHIVFPPTPDILAKATEISGDANTPNDRLRALYDFVSKRVRTVDLPLGVTGFILRRPLDIASSGYAISEEKCALLAVLANGIAAPAIVVPRTQSTEKVPRISAFEKTLVESTVAGRHYWLDPTLEVAPFGMIASSMRGKSALRFFFQSDSGPFDTIGVDAPFGSQQKVETDASLAADGMLKSSVKYTMRGDNELLLRVAFHQAPREKWNEVAQLLALSDGFRGNVSNVTASDPYETHSPFTVECEISQPRFVDWSKKPLRIPALLPLLGLPDPPAKPAPGAAPQPIDLGTPLDVEVSATVHLPAGTIAHIPTGASVSRDFATYTSEYSAKDATVTASRHLNFILREIPADRAADYNAFLRTVQNDESQTFTLERADTQPVTPKKP